jgi:signal transduction histidine kinase
MDQLEESNERLQQFAYIASHDLQEPLRMVSSYMSLLESEYKDELDDEAQEYIDFAADGADRMQQMIDALLEYSRVRTDGEAFAETDANAVLTETLQSLELRIDESGATVTSDDLPTVEADRSQLGQLFQNLISNAIDHADGPTIHVGSETRAYAVVFSVTDDGPGIPESQQETIFELFRRGDRDGDGTGMGLAICDRIVSRHGGDIWVESEEGEGATFSFSIPR